MHFGRFLSHFFFFARQKEQLSGILILFLGLGFELVEALEEDMMERLVHAKVYRDESFLFCFVFCFFGISDLCCIMIV